MLSSSVNEADCCSVVYRFYVRCVLLTFFPFEGMNLLDDCVVRMRVGSLLARGQKVVGEVTQCSERCGTARRMQSVVGRLVLTVFFKVFFSSCCFWIELLCFSHTSIFLFLLRLFMCIFSERINVFICTIYCALFSIRTVVSFVTSQSQRTHHQHKHTYTNTQALQCRLQLGLFSSFYSFAARTSSRGKECASSNSWAAELLSTRTHTTHIKLPIFKREKNKQDFPFTY